MKNIIKVLIILSLVSFVSLGLHAEEKRSSLYYLKLGVIHPPGDSTGILPSFGLGARFQRGYYGFDLSANLGTAIFINYASLKGLFLFYPRPEKKHQLYCGIGPGIGYHLSSVPLGQPFGAATSKCGHVTLEACLGYEFRHTDHFKTFIQLELSQPIVGFGGHGSRSYKPGVAVVGGIGF